VRRAVDSAFVHAVKLYPAGATTNSDAGSAISSAATRRLPRWSGPGCRLLVHGEVTDPEVDVFDREKRFIERVLEPLLARYPGLKIVFEHITTRDAADFVRSAGPNLAATITAHHLLYNRNAIFAGGIRPHHYCLPVLKREEHRLALVRAATSGNQRFFLGTDSAPHARTSKETACGCAGCYTAHAALELYAEAFESAGALDRLEAFASFNGADFYGLPRNTGTVTLARRSGRLLRLSPISVTTRWCRCVPASGCAGGCSIDVAGRPSVGLLRDSLEEIVCATENLVVPVPAAPAGGLLRSACVLRDRRLQPAFADADSHPEFLLGEVGVLLHRRHADARVHAPS
jgi:dihydroorotase (homodimeric type)